LSLDEDSLRSGHGERSASGDLPIDDIETGCGTAKVDVSGMASVGGTSECTVVTLTSSSAGIQWSVSQCEVHNQGLLHH